MEKEMARSRYLQIFHKFGRLNFDFLFRDMSRSEFILLQKIYIYTEQYPDAEGMQVSEIASQLRVTSPAVSRMLRTLEAKGFVERSEGREDRRSTFIRLTGEGNSARREVYSASARYFERVFQRFGDEDTFRFLKLAERLFSIIEKESVLWRRDEAEKL